ncbi:hypothetical protein FALCPG4_012045 [Fusarium falciforme]
MEAPGGSPGEKPRKPAWRWMRVCADDVTLCIRASRDKNRDPATEGGPLRLRNDEHMRGCWKYCEGSFPPSHRYNLTGRPLQPQPLAIGSTR